MIAKTTGHVVGIDYSMTCPCVCSFDIKQKDFNFFNCRFVFQSDKLIRIAHNESITQKLIPKEFASNEERWDMISGHVMEYIYLLDPVLIGVEQYSFGSRSNNNSQMGEHTGLLKHKLWKHGKPFIPVNITHVKMISGAEGGGNANKGQMLKKLRADEPEAVKYIESTVGLKVTQKKKGDKTVEYVDSPAGDIIDAYYLTKYTIDRFRGDILEPVKKVKKKPKAPKKPS